MMKTSLVIACSALIACAMVPSEDDPRSTAEFAEDGSCSGLARDCEDRTVSACTGGCAVRTGCGSPHVATCASLTTVYACDANTKCRWSGSYQRCDVADICYIWDTPSECSSDSDGCVWGSVCGGSAPSCYDKETSASCKAEGCTWEPGQ